MSPSTFRSFLIGSYPWHIAQNGSTFARYPCQTPCWPQLSDFASLRRLMMFLCVMWKARGPKKHQILFAKHPCDWVLEKVMAASTIRPATPWEALCKQGQWNQSWRRLGQSLKVNTPAHASKFMQFKRCCSVAGHDFFPRFSRFYV